MVFRNLTALLLCFMFFYSYQVEAKNIKSKVIAKVGDVEISSQVFEAHLKESYQNSELIKYSPPMQRRVLNKLIDKILITLIAEKDSQILSKVSDKEREALNKISAAVFYKPENLRRTSIRRASCQIFEKNAPKKAVKFMKFHIEDEGTANRFIKS